MAAISFFFALKNVGKTGDQMQNRGEWFGVKPFPRLFFCWYW